MRGRGTYDLTSDEALARRRVPWRGAGRVMAAEGLPPLLAAYSRSARAAEPCGPAPDLIPVALIAAGALRPATGSSLRVARRRGGALKQDFEGQAGDEGLGARWLRAIPALLPPRKRRALVLIDPALRGEGRVRRADRAVRGASARFQAAAMLVWIR